MKIALTKILQFPIFFNEVANKKMPMQTLYKIFTAKRKVDEIEAFYTENFQKIVVEHSIKDEKGFPKTNEEGGVLIAIDQIDECQAQLKELSELLIDFPDISFSFSELEGLELTLEILESISPLINE